MNIYQNILLTVAGLLLLGLLSGQGCLADFNIFDTDSTSKADDGTSGASDATGGDSSEDSTAEATDEINVQFFITAKVTTSLGSGVNDVKVKFTADKHYWNDYEEEWEFRRSADAERSTGTVDGEYGVTGTWNFGYNLHPNETVFISATNTENGNKAETTFTYAQAKAQAGSGKTTGMSHQFTLDSGI